MTLVQQDHDQIQIETPDLAIRRRDIQEFVEKVADRAFHADPRWLSSLSQAFSLQPFLLVARSAGQVSGLLPLVYHNTWLFGKLLVSLPYLNQGGVVALDGASRDALIDAAARLADRLDVRSLQLRHVHRINHPRLTHELDSKVLMHLPLPAAPVELWDRLKPKVRNQVRKGEKHDFSFEWGDLELVDPFYDLFSHKMRDLGTPVYSIRLFQEMLQKFPDEAELCVVRAAERPVATALLVHGPQSTEVLSAVSLSQYNPTCVNMLMYWKLLQRSIERGQTLFDFGRSSPGSNTHRFKKQWGAKDISTVWQYYLRQGEMNELRPESGKYAAMIRVWQQFPIWFTRLIGPGIVRGIP